ncbi:hypothetical protein PFISCL1PPCAC_23100, partial [Pristionchus fissidentatus]
LVSALFMLDQWAEFLVEGGVWHPSGLPDEPALPSWILNRRRMASRQYSDTISLVDPVEIEVGVGIPLHHHHHSSSTTDRGLTAAAGDAPDTVLSTSCPSDEGYCSPGHREVAATRGVLARAMTEQEMSRKRVYKVVLTGGPCGGKTTGQERLATFFENMGWKVYTVPETATVLLSGGVKFAELTSEQAYEFQKDLLLTLIRIEDVFFRQAELEQKKRVLIICDRGAMDPSAYIDQESWQKMLKECGLEQFNLRENRYDQVVHLVTAADGAEKYYTQANNKTRSEGIQLAMDMDKITRTAWLGHPYVDVIDNIETPSFEDKIRRLIEVISDRAGVEVSDRLKLNSKKRKWLVLEIDEADLPKYEEFEVKHDYLMAENKGVQQVRLRSRCQNNRTTYTLTTRTYAPPSNKMIETRMQLSMKDYQSYYRLKDKQRQTIHKLRRCFSHGTQYFNLDIYVDPLPPACLGKRLMILETYTTKPVGDAEPSLPPFLKVEKEITGDSDFSMYSLSYNSRAGGIPPTATAAAAVAAAAAAGPSSPQPLSTASSASALPSLLALPTKTPGTLSYADLKNEMRREREGEEARGAAHSPAAQIPADEKTSELFYNEDADDA